MKKAPLITFQPIDLSIVMLLERMKHPMVVGEKLAELKLQDLVIAAFVFSQPEEANAAFLEGEKCFAEKVFEFGRQFKPKDWPALGEQVALYINTMLGEKKSTATA